MKPTKQQPDRSGSASAGYETISTRLGVRLVQHGTVLSEIRATPGPTHSVADGIAAVVHATALGKQMAMLGFAGGGIMAPLRAMGGDQEVTAVDLDDSGWRVFRRLCSKWAGEVHFERAEACAWLRNAPCRYDVIIEDLSVPLESDVFKPAVTWAKLPPLIYRHLALDGVVIFNLLRPREGSWATGLGGLLRNGFDARLIHFSDYENRLLTVSRRLLGARQFSLKLRQNLRGIRSRLASRFSVRSCGD